MRDDTYSVESSDPGSLVTAARRSTAARHSNQPQHRNRTITARHGTNRTLHDTKKPSIHRKDTKNQILMQLQAGRR